MTESGILTEEDKIRAGILFSPGDPQLRQLKLHAHHLNQDYNQTYEEETEKRNAIIKQLVGQIGEHFFLQGPIFFHYGIHTIIGDDFFANFHLTIQDDGEVRIGDRCNFGPNVTIVTPLHPMLPDERREMLDSSGGKSMQGDPAAERERQSDP